MTEATKMVELLAFLAFGGVFILPIVVYLIVRVARSAWLRAEDDFFHQPRGAQQDEDTHES